MEKIKPWELRANEREKEFYHRMKKKKYVMTGIGKVNRIVGVTRTTYLLMTDNSTFPIEISRQKIKEAAAFFYYKRQLVRKELEKFTKFSSAMLGIIKDVFIRESKINKGKKGLLILILKGVRYFFSGLDRSKNDLFTVKENGGYFILMSYFYLRDKKDTTWKKRIKNLGSKILLDSGAFSLWHQQIAYEQGKRKVAPVPIKLEDYLDFIDSHHDILYGYVSLDIVTDPIQSEKNFNHMIKKGYNPIPVWHCRSRDFGLLDKYVQQDYPIIGIGGSVGLSEKERKEILNEVFKRHPDQCFHGFGISSRLLFEYPFFSVDSTSYLVGRKYKKILTINGQKKAPMEWDEQECLAFNVKFLAGLEHPNYSIC